MAALASAAKSRPILRTTCAMGEISLTGQVRPVPQLNHRLQEAARLGFTRALVPPDRHSGGRKPIQGLEVVEVTYLAEALEALGLV